MKSGNWRWTNDHQPEDGYAHRALALRDSNGVPGPLSGFRFARRGNRCRSAASDHTHGRATARLRRQAVCRPHAAIDGNLLPPRCISAWGTIARLACARIGMKLIRSSAPHRKRGAGPAMARLFILYVGAPHESHVIHGSSFARCRRAAWWMVRSGLTGSAHDRVHARFETRWNSEIQRTDQRSMTAPRQ